MFFYSFICITYIELIHWFLLFWLFFFKQKTAYEMRISDWSSDVCSSDLAVMRHDDFQAEQPRDRRQQSGADRMDVDQAGAALARRQHGEESRHDRFEMLRARAGDADDLDPAMFARRLGQIGRAAEHARGMIGPQRLDPRQPLPPMAFEP